MENTEKHAKAGQYLTFVINSRPYGVPISVVREINQVSDITPVPQTPEYVVGVMNLRGKVVPVVDLKHKFGMDRTQYTRETCIIVIEGDHGQIGMIVDSVSEVVELTAQQIEPPPVLGDEARLAYVMGMGKIESKVIILVDIVLALSRDSLLARTEATQRLTA